MRRRQANRQLYPDDAGGIGSGSLDFLGDPKQGEDEEAVILCLVPTVGDTLVGEQIVFALVLQHIRAKGLHLALRQAGDKRLAPHQLTCSYPIETVRGRYGGGVKIADGYYVYRKALTPKQAALLQRLRDQLDGDDLIILNSILLQFTF